VKLEKLVSKWMSGKLTDKEFRKQLKAEQVPELQKLVFDAIQRKVGTVPENKTVQ